MNTHADMLHSTNKQEVKGSREMDNNMKIHLRQTAFRVEQLKNIVGVGNTTAYHIEVAHGPTLGTLGTVHGPYPADAVNEARFESASLASRLRRALAALRK